MLVNAQLLGTANAWWSAVVNARGILVKVADLAGEVVIKVLTEYYAFNP